MLMGRRTVIYQNNPNTGLTKMTITIKASATLANGELYNLFGSQVLELRVGETGTWTQKIHRNESGGGGRMNIQASGVLISPTEFQTLEDHWVITCD